MSLSDSNLGVSVAYPLSFYAEYLNTDSGGPAPLELRSSQKRLLLGGGALPPGDSENDFAAGSGTLIGVSPYNTTAFNITKWFQDNASGDTLENVSPYSVAGLSAYLIVFTGEIGAGRPMVVVPRNGVVYTIGYESTFDPASLEDAAGLQTFYSIVRSIQFTN
jgi:hypothetical protein